VGAQQAANGSTPAPPIVAVLDRYARGEEISAPIATDATLRTALRDLQRAAPAWIRAASPEREASRRLAVAAYVIELVKTATVPTLWNEGQAASNLLDYASTLLRQNPPTSAERAWYAASIILLQRSAVPAAVLRQVAKADARFPHDPLSALARAVAEEHMSWPRRQENADVLIPSKAQEAHLAAAYQQAIANPALAQEAHLRWGFYELEVGHAEAALTQFDQVGRPDDVILRYWLHLFMGRALARMHRTADAIFAYESALQDVPNAQSASVALGVLLTSEHRPSEAASLVAKTMAAKPALDPWTFYWFPELRLWNGAMAEIRQEITR
jgi:tetratricopeptide (TPR) repeat protein